MKFILENIKAILSIVIMIAIIFIGYQIYDSYQSKGDLKAVINKRDGTIDTLNGNNKALKDNIDTLDKSNKISNAAVEKSLENHSTKIRESKQTNAIVEKKVDGIKAEYNADIKKATTPEDTAALAVKKDKAISKTRLDGLWANYCKTEPSAPECEVAK